MQRVEYEAPVVAPMPLSSAELVREAMDEAKELIRLEVALAKDEVKREAADTKYAGIAFGIGGALLVVGVSLLFVALALAIFPGPIPSLVLGLALLTIAVIACWAGVRLLPKKPLAETRRRIEADVERVRERVA
jgi:Putative Actinobacterial Holin-X, holin superfamily III